ncbi:hypothetical protein J2P12_02465 [Candidatus Bathyarchaeota archaeon]|nr:hypothetical protein [Candidatus Bathyarchaeota archaeon]
MSRGIKQSLVLWRSIAHLAYLGLVQIEHGSHLSVDSELDAESPVLPISTLPENFYPVATNDHLRG